MIARLTVVDGSLTEYPLAEKTKGGWQNGVTFYPDEKVTKVVELRVSAPSQRVDNTEQALLHVERASRDVSANWESLVGERKTDILALAQVHATLALVEQQRIANLITVAGWVQDQTSQEVGSQLDNLRLGVAGEVWEALGILTNEAEEVQA